MNENVLFHLQIPRTVKAKYAILPGDPARVSKIASYLEDADYLVSNREYTTYFGTLCGENVLVTSTGIGGPSTAIALEELHMLGVDTIIRVGTCGGMQETVKSGDLIIATSAFLAAVISIKEVFLSESSSSASCKRSLSCSSSISEVSFFSTILFSLLSMLLFNISFMDTTSKKSINIHYIRKNNIIQCFFV